jgi:hypothetical protein
MFRRTDFDAVGGYRPEFAYWEDLDLYLRLSTRGRILVVPTSLYRYRFHDTSSMGGSISPQEVRAVNLMLRCLTVRRAGGDYTHAADLENPSSLDPMSLYFLAARRLWAGHSPGILRYLPRVRPRRPSLIWLGLLVLATAGDLAPRTVRSALRTLIRLRDAWASRLIPGEGPVEWRFE